MSSVRSAYQSVLAPLYPQGEILALFKLALSHTTGSALPFQPLTPAHINRLHDILQQLATGRPIQHILGSTTFMGHSFATGPSALIPRPETEELVQHAFAFAKTLPGVPAILDVGTGTGCIAITLKHLIPQANILGIDISADAVALATLNAAQNNARVSFQTISINSFTCNRPFNVIVSNPPYIPQSLGSTMHINVTGFEPHIALFVPDTDPLIIYKHILNFSRCGLSRAGGVCFEIHPPLTGQLRTLLATSGFTSIRVLKDINGNNRFIAAVKS